MLFYIIGVISMYKILAVKPMERTN